MKKTVITRDCVKTLLETKFVKVYDLQYEEGKHYYDATRREADRLTALKTDEEFRNMQPDAVSCCVIVRTPGEEPRLLLTYEYRYPCGRFLLSPPAGLIDEEDRGAEDALVRTAVREIREETGLEVKPTDRVTVANPCVFSSPGLTDECNAMACAVADLPDGFTFNSGGTESIEMIGDYVVYGKDEIQEMMRRCTDREGVYFSVFTWAAMMYFVSGMWKERL